MSAASQFCARLGADVAANFSGEVTYRKSAQRLTWTTSFGSHSIAISGSNKWSPMISVAFYFGNRYEEASSIERLLGKRGSELRPSHIHNYSHNACHMDGLTFDCATSWSVDIQSPPSSLANEIADAIRQIAFPFWHRYPTMRSAREGMLSGDTWCFQAGGPIWLDLLYLDAALGELDHYEAWVGTLDAFYVPHASAELERVRRALGGRGDSRA